jgi:hypothetical protein
MSDDNNEQKRRRSGRDLWRLVLVIIGVVAVVQELRKPASERSWHGQVAGFVPYDFRKPTVERFRESYWNEAGPIFSPRPIGVGWVPNFGAMKRMVDDWRSS